MMATKCHGGSMYQFEILGPMVIRHDGQSIGLQTPMLRRLTAVLLCRPGQPMTMDSLLDVMWESDPPETARKTVQVYIHRLRRALGDDNRVSRSSSGYALLVKDGEFDAAEFVRLLRSANLAERIDLGQAGETYERAIALWRGRAFEDALHCGYVAGSARLLEELRLDAHEKYAAAYLRLGRPDRITSALANAVLASPYAEKLRGQLMLAYYRGGRQAEALAEYRDIHRHMNEELGIDPGADLQRLHDQILRNDPALELDGSPGSIAVRSGPIAPAQLPRRTTDFTGRAKELAELDSLVSATQDDSPLIVTIAGMAGVGKTTLAVQWAHNLAKRFPGGQLYVNLRGFDQATVLHPADALRGFLAALGVTPEQIPSALAEQTALFRSKAAGRTMIVLLDNARDPDQVRPLLPGSGRHVVIVTSRAQLTGLVVAEGAHPVLLDVLTEHESWRLLADRLTHSRIAAEEAATRRIIARCSRLPLALAVVAARVLVQQEVSLESMAGSLERVHASLDALDTGDISTNVRAAFSWSYRSLPTPTARIFRLLGVHPGPTVDAVTLANIAELPTAIIEHALLELTEAQLVIEESSQRYGMHDLLRQYAFELLHEVETELERRVALNRLLDFYMATAHGAAKAIHPRRLGVDLPGLRTNVEPVKLTSNETGQEWFAHEFAALCRLVELAGESRMEDHAWRIAWAISDYAIRQANWPRLETVQRSALKSAQRIGHAAGQGYAHRYLGVAAAEQHRHEESYQSHSMALKHFAAGDLLAEQVPVYLDLASTSSDPATSHGYALEALSYARTSRFLVGEANALNAIGYTFVSEGKIDRGITYVEEALEIQLRIGDHYGAAATWSSLGLAHHQQEDFRQAIACYAESIRCYREIGRVAYVADALVLAGDSHAAAGNLSEAQRMWAEAQELYERLGSVPQDLLERLIKL
jgi:DNA-binding SARP family transcriptional activator